MARTRWIRASEISEYVFCRRAWWLHHVQGIESTHRAPMDAGIVQHLAHGRAVQRADWIQRVAIACLGIALFLATLFVLALILSLT